MVCLAALPLTYLGLTHSSGTSLHSAAFFISDNPFIVVLGHSIHVTARFAPAIQPISLTVRCFIQLQLTRLRPCRSLSFHLQFTPAVWGAVPFTSFTFVQAHGAAGAIAFTYHSIVTSTSSSFSFQFRFVNLFQSITVNSAFGLSFNPSSLTPAVSRAIHSLTFT